MQATKEHSVNYQGRKVSSNDFEGANASIVDDNDPALLELGSSILLNHHDDANVAQDPEDEELCSEALVVRCELVLLCKDF